MIQRRSGMSYEEVVQWLLAKAKPDGECLISHLRPNKRGYAPVGIGGRNGEKWRAHRLVYHIMCRPITKSELVLHRCDIRTCIKPEHLYVGTAADNTNDMLQRNRGANQYLRNFNRRR